MTQHTSIHLFDLTPCDDDSTHLNTTPNRYAGRAFETDHDAVNMRGKFVVKGLTSTWRQAAPVVSYILGGALQRIIMQQDVQGAVDFVQHHVAMLLSGVLEPWHCTMTGGLWRVTGEQVAAAAAADGIIGGGGGGVCVCVCFQVSGIKQRVMIWHTHMILHTHICHTP